MSSVEMKKGELLSLSSALFDILKSDEKCNFKFTYSCRVTTNKIKDEVKAIIDTYNEIIAPCQNEINEHIKNNKDQPKEDQEIAIADIKEKHKDTLAQADEFLLGDVKVEVHKISADDIPDLPAKLGRHLIALVED